MKTKRWHLLIGALVMVLVLAWPVQAGPDAQTSVVESSCQALGYGLGFRLELSADGTFAFTSAHGELTGGAPEDPLNQIELLNVTPTSFDWSATLPVDAVILNGGASTNVVAFEPEEKSGAGLALDEAGSAPISHAEFCYDYELAVDRKLATSFKRTHQWAIQTSANPSRATLLSGESDTVQHQVTVRNSAMLESDWLLDGQIFVENRTPLDATIESVTYSFTDGTEAPVVCNVDFPYVLESGRALACSTSLNLPDSRRRSGEIEVLTAGSVSGSKAAANVNFRNATITEEGESIRVQDSLGGALGSVTFGFDELPASFTYERTLACNADAGPYTAIAAIVETGQEDSVTVELTCSSQACAPRFWRQPQQAQRWENFEPDDDFDTAFTVDVFDPDITLLDALQLDDDDENVWARHAAAALLNAAREDIAYWYSLDELYELVQEAVEAEDYDALIGALEEANAAQCPFEQVRRPAASPPDPTATLWPTDSPPAGQSAPPANPPTNTPTTPPTVAPTNPPTTTPLPTVPPTTPPTVPPPTNPPPPPPPTDPPPPPPPADPGPPNPPPPPPPDDPDPPDVDNDDDDEDRDDRPGRGLGRDKGKDKDKDDDDDDD